MGTLLFYLALFWHSFWARFRRKPKKSTDEILLDALNKSRESWVDKGWVEPLPEEPEPVEKAEITPQPLPTRPASYVDSDFTLCWKKSDWSVPGMGSDTHSTFFDPEQVQWANKELIITLWQFSSPSCIPSDFAIYSKGGELKSKERFGYGTFEWLAKMPKTISGSVASLGVIFNDGETEINFETCGDRPEEVCCSHFVTSKFGKTASGQSDWVPFGDLSDNYHKFQIVWSKRQLDFYVDDVPIYSTVEDVPSTKANIFMAHYGSNDTWGGLATLAGAAVLDIDRSLRVKQFSYTPAS